jgi:hypothetical protein
MVMSRHMPPSPGDFLHNALTGEELAPNGREPRVRERDTYYARLEAERAAQRG